MGLLTVIGNGLKALAAICGWGAQRDAEKNTPDQQANAGAKQDQVDSAQGAKDVASPNLDQLRKDVAE